MSLQGARKGYLYQDLIVATQLVDVILGETDKVWVDEKKTNPDKFDDFASRSIQDDHELIQIKHTDQDKRLLELQDFNNSDNSDPYLEDLLSTAIAYKEGPGADASNITFRYFANYGEPKEKIKQLLSEPGESLPPLLSGDQTRRFKFDVNTLWSFIGQEGDIKDHFGSLRENFDEEDVKWFLKRFVIEVGAPEASFDSRKPGELEGLLINRLKQEVGAGSYPNTHRDPIDVAAALIETAKGARVGEVHITRQELLKSTRLQSDFGSVSKANPVNKNIEVTRTEATEEVISKSELAADNGIPLLITGPPGHGKSWIMKQVSKNLDNQCWDVVEHYCYIEGSEQEREARVKTSSIIGSFIKRLEEKFPNVVEEKRPRYAATVEKLENILQGILTKYPEKSIAVIVDGLDHATRVRGRNTNELDPARIIANNLAKIDLPLNTTLIVASQPGEHLEPLRELEAIEMEAPPFSREDLKELAQALGVLQKTSEASKPTQSLIEPENDSLQRDFFDALEERSAGNALYATYLCQELLGSSKAQIDPVQIIWDLPEFDENLEGYYEYLYTKLGESHVAELLGLVEFTITKDEIADIKNIRPEFIGNVLTTLRPVLKETQSGYGVYHESFSRYLTKKLEKNPEIKAGLLDEVIDWLTGIGLFTDGRAYRFLLPTKAKAGYDQEVVKQVDKDFLVNSVEAGFMPSAIIKNIETASKCAGNTGNWPALARFVELSKAAASYEYERIDILIEFFDVLTEQIEADKVAERLLFGGKTTVPSREGLQLCKKVDEHGVVAPWEKYIDIYEKEQEENNTSYGEASEKRVALAYLRGKLRTILDKASEIRKTDEDGPEVIFLVSGDNLIEPDDKTINEQLEKEKIFSLDRLADWINNNDGLPADEIVGTVWDVIGPPVLPELFDLLQDPFTYKLAFAEKVDSENPTSIEPSATGIACSVAEGSIPTGSVNRLFEMNVPLKKISSGEDEDLQNPLIEKTKNLQEENAHLEPERIKDWLDICKINARLDPSGIDEAKSILSGEGWYPCWLSFVLDLCKAEEKEDNNEKSKAALEALNILTQDVRPFAGSPRASDLHSIRGIIKSTIGRALQLIEDEEWSPALEVLKTIGKRLGLKLRGAMAGPVRIDSLLELIINNNNSARQETSMAYLDSIISEHSEEQYYGNLARFHLFRARLAMAGNDSAKVEEEWNSACELFTSYRFHKDTTIFELLEPLPSLINEDELHSRVLLEKTQSLCLRALNHSDGKETNGALPKWWKLLAEADPLGLVQIIGPELLDDCNMPQERLDKTRLDLWRAHRQKVNPLVAGALRLTLMSGLEKEDPDLMERLLNSLDDENNTRFLAKALLSRVDERPLQYSNSGSNELLKKDSQYVQQLNELAEKNNIRTLNHNRLSNLSQNTRKNKFGRSPEKQSTQEFLDSKIIRSFGKGKTGLREIIRTWHNSTINNSGSKWAVDRFVNLIGYRMHELIEKDMVDEVRTAIRRLASINYSDSKDMELLSKLGKGFERLGREDLTALTYTLRWTRARGGGGWLTFGGKEGLDDLSKAASINSDLTLHLVAEEVGRAIASDPIAVNGISQALIFAFAHIDFGELFTSSSVEIAFDCWEEAFSIIDSRLPRVGDRDDPSPKYENLTQLPPRESYFPKEMVRSIAQNEGKVSRQIEFNKILSAATVAGLAHPGREQKRRSLIAISMLLEESPESIASGIKMSLDTISDCSTLSWLLSYLKQLNCNLEPVLRHCKPELRALLKSNKLTVRVLARKLLKTIQDDLPSPPATEPAGKLFRHSSSLVSRFGKTDSEVKQDAKEEHVKIAKSIVKEFAESRIAKAEQLVPNLRREVMNQLVARVSSDIFQERFQAQIDALSSGNKNSLPNAILEDFETTEEILQRLAAGARIEKAQKGKIIKDATSWEDRLAQTILDSPSLPLKIEKTRRPRPEKPIPPDKGAKVWQVAEESAITGQYKEKESIVDSSIYKDSISATLKINSGKDLPTVNSGPREGWRIIASAERREINQGPAHDEDFVTGSRFCGIEHRPKNITEGLDVFPFAAGNAKYWIQDLRRQYYNNKFEKRATPLVGIDLDSDFLGDMESGLGWSVPLLVPTVLFKQILQLSTSTKGLTLEKNGRVAMELITWRSYYTTSDYELKRPQLYGSQVILRPDVYEALLEIKGAKIVFREFIRGSLGLTE
ncbi:ATP-binding protein [Candidatus Bipolaricaulota bacterium]|nr:ATP-binding protein [Candidatus Bipolaricaulota bacterium]